ncbi:hypothetical protein N431DRAFT_83391 [Stipitochalara longipes BDJ]|nr:hypothetical protein N431DRAFT_83391 [Stipitochalara longipes BDJ]
MQKVIVSRQSRDSRGLRPDWFIVVQQIALFSSSCTEKYLPAIGRPDSGVLRLNGPGMRLSRDPSTRPLSNETREPRLCFSHGISSRKDYPLES